MYGLSLLKPRAEATSATVTCPIRGCRHQVPIQPSLFRTSPEFKCPLHRIYVSATTFAYEREADNLLWTEDGGLQLLNATKSAGRYGFLSYDNSERAATWNVFRWLELSGALGGLLERWTGRSVPRADVTYWSYSPERDGCIQSLVRTRTAFEEKEPNETTPAVIVETDEVLFVVDPHLGPGGPAPRSPRDWERYETGGRDWSGQVLTGDIRELASDAGSWDLVRQWLIGTHMAQQTEKSFALLHLVPAWSSKSIFESTAAEFEIGPEREVLRATWEDVYAYVLQEHAAARDAAALLTYMEEKPAGYGSDGILRRAFSLEAHVAAES